MGEIAEQVVQYRGQLDQKARQMRAMQNEVKTYQQQVMEYKDEVGRVRRELQQVKRKFFEQKKREQSRYEQRPAEAKLALQPNVQLPRYTGGGSCPVQQRSRGAGGFLFSCRFGQIPNFFHCAEK